MVGVVASNARVGSRQKRDFLATLRLQLESGLPLVGSLHQQAEFSGDPACQACCAAMAQSIEAGNTLAEAAAGCRGLFTRFEVVAIAEGERRALARCFDESGVVRDEGREHRGVAAIEAWHRDTNAKASYVVEPLDASAGGSDVVVRARVSGDFPGSPAELRHRFTLKGERIALLEVTP